MGLTKINGINLNVTVLGNGQPLILLHGIGGDHTQMEIIAKPLSKHFKTIALDCRGHGKSDKPPSYTLQDHINDILGIMDHYQIENTFLLGVSMGSYIAQAVAIAAPQRIEKLVLTVPKSSGSTSSLDRLKKEHAKELEESGPHDTTLVLLKYMTYDPDAMKDHLDLFHTRLSSKQFAAADEALTDFDFRDGLPTVTAKTLVISGKHDGLNPPAEGKECASLIPDATFVEMKYSGHAPLYEEQERYLKIVEDFLMK